MTTSKLRFNTNEKIRNGWHVGPTTNIQIDDIRAMKEQQKAMAWCKDLVDTVDVFFRAPHNQAKLHEYIAMSMKATGTEDYHSVMRQMIKCTGNWFADVVDETDLEMCRPAFEEILSATRDADYHGRRATSPDVTMAMARRQGYVCPLCGGQLNFLTQEIVCDHDWDRRTVGDRIEGNTQAVHKECNEAKGSRHTLPRTFTAKDILLSKI